MVLNRIPEYTDLEVVDQALADGEILGTIVLPNNLRILTSRLPKPNYDTPQIIKK